MEKIKIQKKTKYGNPEKLTQERERHTHYKKYSQYETRLAADNTQKNIRHTKIYIYYTSRY